MINKNLEKLIDLSKVKIRAERIALDLTQEEFSEFVDIKYATYKSFEQNGKISFENYIKILIKLNKDDQFLKFLNSFEFDEQKQRASSKKIDENSIINNLIKPIIEVSQKQIVLDKKIFGEELFYSVENGHIYDIPNFINIVLSSWNDKRLMLLIKYFGEDRLKPYIFKKKDIKLLKSFNSHLKYIREM